MIERALKILNVREIAFSYELCPLCGPSIIVRLRRSSLGVRCLRCRGSGIHASIARVVGGEFATLGEIDAYELSARGPWVRYLRRHCRNLTVSEFFPGVDPGERVKGVECQDVQNLIYPDNTFDLCTSTEVFEHVPDDRKGFSEIFRVLRPGGHIVFTVPLADNWQTVERALIQDGQIKHLLPPEYHGDRLRGFGGVLAFRNYGRDVTERLSSAGFSKARIVEPPGKIWWGLCGPVILATKPAVGATPTDE
jgi:SAM-dependent methyltransferase